MAVENPDEFIGPSTFSELPGVGEDFYFGQIVNAKGSIDEIGRAHV